MIKVLNRRLPKAQILTNERMEKHTSFKIGGPAQWYIRITTTEELRTVVAACREQGERFTLLGCGSNVLISDNGLPGVVAQTYPAMGGLRVYNNDHIAADAGISLAKLSEIACRLSLDGLAFASGIPGTVGGALYMNAGAYGHDMSEVCEMVEVLMPEGDIITLWNRDMQFAYRKSVLQENGGMVLSAVFRLTPGDQETIRTAMLDFNARRKESQPLAYPSAGSVFKRPEGYYAGKLIEDSGLKGYTIGGACVSEKHAGFIINRGGATCEDVVRLIAHIQETVHQRFSVWLEPELRVLE